ncbi:TetR/AcrR family transcriptional regulator [Solihabitans fulvus]|uniref:TetR/AcrR family transcriptional regulator n=1 Tax=Solihabitans fulvus TaxID=1892852 RepID=A0A5B2XTC3_9PSEU|nr:TetR family transcriptional regulator [Solihabitans fulvus]KAA2266104.1 TetR/AcrR family transcriptional regulator [Solihabitans fulvus]
MPPRDANATRARISAAAAAEFAAYGIAGARVERIARQAEANKQLIYAYFGDKEQLFASVLEQQLQVLAEAVPLDADGLDDYAVRLFDYHLEHPEIGRLLLWEALERGDGPVPSEAERTRHYVDKTRAVAVAQERGAADPEIPPDLTVLLLLALVSYPQRMPQLRRMLLGGDSEETQARTRAAVALAARKLIAP